MKICKKCGKEGEFYKKPSGKDRYHCKECQRKYIKAHYVANKDYYVKKQTSRKRRLYLEIICQAKDKPCADCGISFPLVCMDFDHVFGKKKFTIASNYSDVSVEELMAEIKKCEIVCANCHRIRTWILRTRGPADTTVGYEPTNPGAHPGGSSSFESVV